MLTLYTLDVPNHGEQRIVGANDEEVVGLLGERLEAEAEEQAPRATVSAAMIVSRERYAGWDEFADTYTPVKNRASQAEDQPINRMFETFGGELEFVRRQEPERIWTLVEEDGVQWIVAGFHFANRLGYFVTKKEWRVRDELYLYAA